MRTYQQKEPLKLRKEQDTEETIKQFFKRCSNNPNMLYNNRIWDKFVVPEKRNKGEEYIGINALGIALAIDKQKDYQKREIQQNNSVYCFPKDFTLYINKAPLSEDNILTTILVDRYELDQDYNNPDKTYQETLADINEFLGKSKNNANFVYGEIMNYCRETQNLKAADFNYIGTDSFDVYPERNVPIQFIKKSPIQIEMPKKMIGTNRFENMKKLVNFLYTYSNNIENKEKFTFSREEADNLLSQIDMLKEDAKFFDTSEFAEKYDGLTKNELIEMRKNIEEQVEQDAAEYGLEEGSTEYYEVFIENLDEIKYLDEYINTPDKQIEEKNVFKEIAKYTTAAARSTTFQPEGKIELGKAMKTALKKDKAGYGFLHLKNSVSSMMILGQFNLAKTIGPYITDEIFPNKKLEGAIYSRWKAVFKSDSYFSYSFSSSIATHSMNAMNMMKEYGEFEKYTDNVKTVPYENELGTEKEDNVEETKENEITEEKSIEDNEIER